MKLIEVLESRFGWTPDLQPKSGKNKGRYTADRINPRPYRAGACISPRKGSWEDRAPYMVAAADLFPPGTVCHVTAVPITWCRVTGRPIEKNYTGRLISWFNELECGGEDITFVTPELDYVSVWRAVLADDLYAWEIVEPEDGDAVAVAMTTQEEFTNNDCALVLNKWKRKRKQPE